MKRVKVFTKYDEFYPIMHESYFEDLVAEPMGDKINITLCKTRDYKPTKIEYGLEDVRFITYEDV